MLKSLTNRIDALNDWVGKTVSWFTLGLVLVVCLDVFSRFFFDETRAWVMELEWHFFSLIFLLAGGYTLRHDRHVRVDLFYARFQKREKALVNLIGSLILLLPWTLLLLIVSWKYALDSFLVGEGSPDPGGLPARYLIKSVIVLGVFLLLLQAVSEMLKAGSDYVNRKPESQD